MESEHPTLQFSGIIPEKFDDPNHHAALVYDYFATPSLRGQMAGSEDFKVQHAIHARTSTLPIYCKPID
jgi:hypothetical protein